MIKKNKVGFTLIELMAVIVILAIILVVVVPQVFNSVRKSTESVFLIDFKRILEAIEKAKIAKPTLDLSTINKNNINDIITLSVDNYDSINAFELDEKVNVIIEGKKKWKNLKVCGDKSNINIGNIENGVPCSAPPTPDECFVFNSTTKTITDFNYLNPVCLSDIVIPSSISAVDVVTIGSCSFCSKLLTSVIIPNSVTTINSGAFFDNNISTLTIESGLVTIGDYVFSDNELSSLVIPSNVRTIGRETFANNKLIDVTLSSGITSIGKYAFINNKILDIVIPNTVNLIGGGAFNNNNLPTSKAIIYNRNVNGSIDNTKIVSYGGSNKDTITIPSGVTTIGNAAFAYNKLKNINFSSSVTTIEDYAFSNNELTNIIIPNTVTSIGGGAFNNNLLIDTQAIVYGRNVNGSIDYSKLVSYGGTKTDNIIIPYGVTNIYNDSFYRTNITSVTIPESVIIIGAWAFGENPLTNVTIPSSVTTIGDSAFYWNKLVDVVIPNNVTLIDIWAFGDNQLTSITMGSSVSTIGNYAFIRNSLNAVNIPNSTTNIGAYTFRYNYITQGNARIDNSAGSVTIGSAAFNNNGASKTTTITPTYLR